MSDAWAVVVAALGASALTILGTFGLEWWRARRADKAALAERRSRAYSALLTSSASVMHLASDMHVIMEVKSGAREGLNVITGKTKAFDTIDLINLMRSVYQPLYEAWSEVWVVGSKEAVAVANDLVAQGGTVVGAATQRGKAIPTWLMGVVGEKWTKEQLDQWQEEVRNLAAARKKFGEIARKETGREVIDLFISNELGLPPPSQSPQTSH